MSQRGRVLRRTSVAVSPKIAQRLSGRFNIQACGGGKGEPRRLLICPTGKSVAGVSSPARKNISLNLSGKSHLWLRASRPKEGRWPSSRTLGGMRWTFLHQKTNGAKSDGEVVWS